MVAKNIFIIMMFVFVFKMMILAPTTVRSRQ